MHLERYIDKIRNTKRIYMKYYAKGICRNMSSCKVRFKFLGHFRCSTVIWDTLVFIVVLVLVVPIAETCYVFPAGKTNPCLSQLCQFGAECVSSMDGSTARCQCPQECYDYGDSYGSTPICASNGKDYTNFCELRKESCQTMSEIKIKKYGRCDPCENVTCEVHQVCSLNEVRKPICICEKCDNIVSPVCGSDGHTYSNECMLRQQACQTKKDITVLYDGRCKDQPTVDTGPCKSLSCQFDAQCVVKNGKAVCECPTCNDLYDPVCGDNGISYENDCKRLEENCREKKLTRVEHRGLCMGDGCDKNSSICQYYSTCVLRNGLARCVCPSNCSQVISKVCGTDGVTYDNECQFREASCTKQIHILMSFGACEDCNGIQCQYGSDCIKGQCVCPQFCPKTRQPVCANDSITYDSECEMRMLSCHHNTNLIVVRNGECDEEIESGSGQISDQCQCHSLGSVGNTCDPATKQCQCKHGIGGLKCDRCLPGYWGLQLIQDKSDVGCMSCSCHRIGSSRLDCHQMTGRCICKDGYEGHKCNRCKEGVARKIGCDGDVLTLGPTDVPLTTRPRKTTRHIHASNYMTHMTPKRPKSTLKPPMNGNLPKFERIGELCLEDSFCSIPNSHCHLALCQCIDGYIPTYEYTQCSKVRDVPNETVTLIPEEVNTCSLNPCLNSGVCKLDDSLGYRCLCKLGRTGTICKQSTSFTMPSFSGSSYLLLQPLGNISGDFYVDIVFHTMNKDGILLYSSQNVDGTGQFLSIAISNGHVEFRYDTGSGPVQVVHPYQLSQEKYHQVIAKKMGQNSMLIVDGKDPVAAVTITRVASIDLSGSLYIGSVPQNLSFIQEKIGVNLGFVGCVKSLTSKQDNLARTYNLDYPRPISQILDGIDIGPCERNPCQSLPCLNGGTCMMLNSDLYKCLCPKDYTGTNCDGARSICPNSPCHPSSTCVLTGLGEALCQCPDSREGQFCEYEKIAEIVTPEFHGDSYLILPIVDNLSQHTTIEVWLLTKKRNGVILFASQHLGEGGDFISLNIDNLYVELRFDLGDSRVIVRSTHQLSLDSWHKVTVKRVQKEADLIIDDGAPERGTSQGILTELQLSGNIYLGGYRLRSDIPKDSKITENFTGIIQRVYINGHLIENPIDVALEKRHVTKYSGYPCVMNPCMNGGVCVPKLERVECKCPKQFIGQLCEKIVENLEANFPVKFDGSTYLQFLNEITSRVPAQKVNKFQFRFRTRQPSGLIIYQGQASGVLVDYITIAISNGYVELGYNLGKQNKTNLLRAQSSVYVSDGEWHEVYVERDVQVGKLQVDKEKLITAVSAAGAKQLDTDGILWIGGGQNLPENLPSDYYTGFNGCLGDMFVQDKELNLYTYNNGLRNTVEYCH